MLDAAISAHLLAVPDQAEGPARFDEYVEGLLGVNRSVEDAVISPSRSDYTIQALHENSLYPLRPSIEKSVRAFNANYCSPIDIARVAARLIERSVSLEKQVGIDDMVWPLGSCGDHGIRCNEVFLQDTERLMILASMFESQQSRRMVVLVGGEPRVARTVAVEVELDILQMVDGGLFSRPDPRCSVRGTSRFATCCTSASTHVDLVQLWFEASDGGSALRVLRLAVMASSQLHNIADEPRRLSLHRDFLVTAKDLGFCHESAKAQKLLSAVAGLVLGRSLSAAHQLREDRGGSSPARRRSCGDIAWRLDVDYEFHVHYWQQPGGSIELANVVAHNDFDISE